MPQQDIVYRCGGMLWVPLLGIWGATSYASLLVRRQNEFEQFVLATYGLNQCEYAFGDPSHMKRTIGITKAWVETCKICSSRHVENVTPKYLE